MPHRPADAELHDALLAAPLATALLSADGAFVRVNRAWSTLVGRDEGWFSGRMLASLVSDGAGLFDRLRGVRDRALTVSLLRADGGVPVELSGRPFGSAGMVVLYARELRRGGAEAPPEMIPDAAFRDAPVGLGVCDPDFRFQRVNNALGAIFDLPPDQLVGRSYLEFVHPADRAQAEQRIRSARAGGLAAGQVDRRFVTAAGRTVWVRASGVRAGTETDPSYFGVFLDVSDQHRAEEERARLQEQVVHAERLRTLGQIAAGIAHEINNPAAIAIGGVDLARRRLGAAITAARSGDLPGVRRHLDNLEGALRYCEDGTLRVAQAARRLGSFSSLRGGRVEEVDPNDAVRRSIELVRNELRHRARLVVELGEVPRLVAHQERLIQAVTNLLVNAGQAIEGAPDEHAVTVRTWTAGNVVHILIADTGVGMTRDVRERLFEPFFTSRGKDRGTGLGLTVVHDVVSQHRGRIDVWSEPNRGSRFTLELPVDNGLRATTPEASPAGRGGRVLVVDDEPFLLAVVGEILRGEHEVVTAAGGREALAVLAQDTAFDAVLCDLMMPGVDGIEIHSWLLESAPALAARMVFCTGGVFTARAESYLARTGLRVIEKPFTAEDVLACIAEAASRRV